MSRRRGSVLHIKRAKGQICEWDDDLICVVGWGEAERIKQRSGRGPTDTPRGDDYVIGRDESRQLSHDVILQVWDSDHTPEVHPNGV